MLLVNIPLDKIFIFNHIFLKFKKLRSCWLLLYISSLNETKMVVRKIFNPIVKTIVLKIICKKLYNFKDKKLFLFIIFQCPIYLMDNPS